MRKKLTLVLVASALALPAAALAVRNAPGDGSLVVSGADGKLTLQGRGLLFGHLDRGTITVIGYTPDDNTALTQVSGAKLRIVGGNVVYSGLDVRFLFPGGRYTLIVEGLNIGISAVGAGKFSALGAGKFSALGAGTVDDGSVAADGGRPQSIDAAISVSYGKTVAASAPSVASAAKAKS